MKLERILPFARSLLEKAVSPGDIVVDATVGNGHDTLYLARLTGPGGLVYGFDIQQQALDSCMKKLSEEELSSRAVLFKCGHEHVKAQIPIEQHGKITAAIFNLGYLPGGDKSIVTTPDTTLKAVHDLLDIMAVEGIIIVVVYHGHPEGKKEKIEILEFAASLDQQRAHVLQYGFINQKNNPPFIIAIEKRG